VIQPCPAQSEPIEIKGEQAAALAKQMSERLLRRQLDEALLAKANHLKIEPSPKRAQLSRLRELIADELLTQRQTARVKTYVEESIEKRSAARRQFERAKIEGQRLTDWLKRTAAKTGPEDFRQLLGLGETPVKKIGTIEPEWSDDLRAEYVLRLIDLTLAHAAKEGEA
jgi:hypothetical protein